MTTNKKQLTFEQKCEDVEIVAKVTQEIIDFGRKSHLLRYEIPQKMTLCPNQWSPENGLLTSALKLKRKQVQEFYSNDINRMYM